MRSHSVHNKKCEGVLVHSMKAYGGKQLMILKSWYFFFLKEHNLGWTYPIKEWSFSEWRELSIDDIYDFNLLTPSTSKIHLKWKDQIKVSN